MCGHIFVKPLNLIEFRSVIFEFFHALGQTAGTILIGALQERDAPKSTTYTGTDCSVSCLHEGRIEILHIYENLILKITISGEERDVGLLKDKSKVPVLNQLSTMP
jgi:hypothetical protein